MSFSLKLIKCEEVYNNVYTSNTIWKAIYSKILFWNSLSKCQLSAYSAQVAALKCNYNVTKAVVWMAFTYGLNCRLVI